MGNLVSFIDLASGQHWQTSGNIGREWEGGWDDKNRLGRFTLAYKYLIYKCQYIYVYIYLCHVVKSAFEFTS